jgi:uncharacterized protein YkwD
MMRVFGLIALMVGCGGTASDVTSDDLAIESSGDADTSTHIDSGDVHQDDSQNTDTGISNGGLAEDCHAAIADWPSAYSTLEAQVVAATNAARAIAQDCGEEGWFEPAGPVTLDPALQCAARYHSVWMSETGQFSHDSPGGDLGEDPWERMDGANFEGFGVGENIAAGGKDPIDVVQRWIDSDGHCANLMNPDATLIGVGFSESSDIYGSYWTQNFGL